MISSKEDNANLLMINWHSPIHKDKKDFYLCPKVHQQHQKENSIFKSEIADNGVGRAGGPVSLVSDGGADENTSSFPTISLCIVRAVGYVVLSALGAQMKMRALFF